MSFLAPLWLAVAAAVGVGVVVAHLFAPTVPREDFLPTVRFIPEGAPLAVRRSRRVSDPWLLLLRLIAVTLLGFALAGVHVRGSAPARVVVVDRSRAVGSVAELRDSARAAASDGGVVVVFDSVARVVASDSLAALGRSSAPGSLSAAIVVAQRAIAAATDGRSATELVLVTPLVREEVDSATDGLLSFWEGPLRVVRIAAAEAGAVPVTEIRAAGDDPVAAALAQLGANEARARSAAASVRVVRTTPTPADSQWARTTGGVLVLWPADPRELLPRRGRPDSAGGIATSGVALIASFARTHDPRAGRVVVRWIDGAPAATERALGAGCVREVAVLVDAVGDVALRASFGDVVRSLTAPCGGARDFRRADGIQSRAPGLAATSTQRAGVGPDAPGAGALAFWLALAAAVALVGEQILRARRRPTA